MSDSELEEAFIAAWADWATTPGVSLPPPHLERLSVAYSARFLGHPANCVCEPCFEQLEASLPDLPYHGHQHAD